MKIYRVAAVAALALCVLVCASYLTLPVLTGAAVLLSIAVGIGWPRLLGIPARKTLATVIAATGTVAALAASAAPSFASIMWMAPVAGLGVLAVFVVQLIRGTGQSHRLESTIGASAGVLLAALGSGWVAAERLRINSADSGMMLVTGIGVFVAIVVSVLPWPDRMSAPIGVVLAGLAGGLAGFLLADVPLGASIAVGAIGSAIIAGFRRLVLSREEPYTADAALAVGIAPVLAMGALFYFVERLFVS